MFLINIPTPPGAAIWIPTHIAHAAVSPYVDLPDGENKPPSSRKPGSRRR